MNIISLLGGLGIGTILHSVVTHFLKERANAISLTQEKKRDVYLGLLDVYYKRVLAEESSQESRDAFRHAELIVQLYGSTSVCELTRQFYTIPDNKHHVLIDKLVQAMRRDLNKV
ncbi:hypothetical protein [Kiloniella sp. EL199]|uniref:hypothetical protein n=1 Tax=Kiloniella sp. EL199 TaxID=2107581 RepID=UPI000EA3DE5F|nr:hypothetical protein [Kiloniella sp. EL199]